MTHQIEWSAEGWVVVTLLGALVVAASLEDSYADAVVELAALVGVL